MKVHRIGQHSVFVMPFLQVPHDYKERQVLVNGEEESLLHKALVHFSLKGYVHNDIWWRHIGIISVKTPVQHNHNLRSRRKSKRAEVPTPTKHTEEVVVLCDLGNEVMECHDSSEQQEWVKASFDKLKARIGGVASAGPA